jgi:hypothetical protein
MISQSWSLQSLLLANASGVPVIPAKAGIAFFHFHHKEEQCMKLTSQ